MNEIIVFAILAIVSYLLRFLFISLDKDDFKDKKETTGTIARIIDSEYGNISYYVSFVLDDGTCMKGESVYYSSTKGKYKVNDLVTIKY